MYTPEESVDDIKTSLSHIEGLIQRGTELLYGDEQAVGSAAAPGPQAAAAAGAKKTATAKSAVSRPAARGGAKAAAAAAAARTSASPASRQRSSSKPDLAVADMTMKPSTVNPLPPRGRAESKGREGSFFDEELRYEEIDKFFQEDARRIAKLERESRRLRRAEARKKAMSPTDSPAPTHHHTAARRRGAEPEEEEEPPEKVNLEEVRARIHKEVEAYRAMCQKGENPNEASTWSSHKLTPRKDARYVSPYASQQRTKNIWAKPAPMKQPPRRAPSHKAQPASVPIPPRKPRAPIDRSVPIWERLYSDSKQAQSSPSVTGEDDDDNSTTPLYSHIPPSKKLSRTNSTPVQPLHKPAAPQSKLKRSSSAVPKHSSSMLNKPNRDLSPEAAIPPRGRHAGRMERSDSPMNAPVLRHVTTNNHSSVGGGAPPPRGGLMDIELDDENAPTMPFISPLDLRNL